MRPKYVIICCCFYSTKIFTRRKIYINVYFAIFTDYLEKSKILYLFSTGASLLASITDLAHTVTV